MPIRYTTAQRADIAATGTGKTVQSMEYDDEGGYWTMTFTDGQEISFRLMAELA